MVYQYLQPTSGVRKLVRVVGRLREMVIAGLSDPESRRIITAVSGKPMPAVEIKKKIELPQTTLYRKISELKACGLLMVDRFVFGRDGRMAELYACPIAGMNFKAVGGEIELELIQTKESAERRWFELFLTTRGLRQSEPIPAVSGSSG